jgi:exonuclease SbcC
MRIEKVRFKNLNSLVGEWEIDFDQLAPDGIFAITGPTGAGKTTILDAVCLALYGATPRLGKIPEKTNEIMSRHTVECYAEVTFETKAGRYRCHWSHRRKRKKPHGDLSSPKKHELIDDNTGRIVQEKIRGVAAEIEKVTGMDFNQFTRSMLLAQGDFDKFLHAPADQRSPILEQITGTEIYTRISIRTHERCVAERNALTALEGELAGIPILSPEEAQKLRDDLERKKGEEAELGALIEKTNASIAWRESVEKLESELEGLEKEKRDLRTRQEAFAPQRERLARAKRALELAGEHQALEALRQRQRSDQSELAKRLNERPACEEARNRAAEEMRQAAERLEATKTFLEKALPEIRKAAEMDLRIREKDKPIKEALERLQELERRRNDLGAEHKKRCEELSADRDFLKRTLDDLEASRSDEKLVQDLTGIVGRAQAIKEAGGRGNAKIREVADAQAQLDEREETKKKRAADLESAGLVRERCEEALTAKRAELENALEGKEAAYWRSALSTLTDRRHSLDKLLETARTLDEARGKARDLEATGKNLEGEKTALDADVKALRETKSRLEKEVEELEALFTTQRFIRSFDEARDKLQDGVPCPLCGSLDHPYARGNVPVPDETKRRLAAARRDLKAAEKAVSDWEVAWAKLEKDIERVSAELAQQRDKIAQSERFVNNQCAALQLDAEDPDLVRTLEKRMDEAAREAVRVTGVLGAVDSLEKAITELIKALDEAKDKLAKAEIDAQKASAERDFAASHLDRLRNEADALQLEIEKAVTKLNDEISAYGVSVTAAPDKLDAVLRELTARRDRWTSLQEKRVKIEKRIVELGIQTRHQAEDIRRTDEEIGGQRLVVDELLRVREGLIRERRDLFGDKNPDEEERRLRAEIDKAEKARDRARALVQAAEQKAATLTAEINALEKSVNERIPQISALEGAFAARLQALDFTGEDDFKASLAPKEERERLEREAQELDAAQTSLRSLEREKRALFEAERAKKVTDASWEELRRALTTHDADRKNLLQEIGGIEGKLTDNDKWAEERERKAAEVERQKAEYARWNRLNELIGSHNGKKYRDFAQGVTFDFLIDRANAQLSKMTDRYELVRREDQSLELDVIDHYQAAEVRSTKNLSGGESFIVSLALALGLSDMVGAKVPVDSLFLDEGFGTLDEDVLDTALETLASLQRENKLIGVISHVAALRERIPAQIRVTPLSGGKSRIEGSGVKRI